MARAVIFRGNDVKRENPAAADPTPGKMRCWRCRGLMIAESSFDRTGDTVHLDYLTRRCVQCGEVIDPVILQNRLLQGGKNVARVKLSSEIDGAIAGTYESRPGIDTVAERVCREGSRNC